MTADKMTGQTYMPFGGFVLFTIGSSFILSWIVNISGNKPFAGLYCHGLSNALIPAIPALELRLDVSQPRYWIWVLITLFTGIIITGIRTFRKETAKVYPCIHILILLI